MTREEIIESLEAYIPWADEYEVNKEVLRRAVELLKQEPSEDMTIAYLMGYYADKEPCDDAISRQAVNEIINDIRDCISVEGYCAILERIKKLPPVNPQEPKTGHWIKLPKNYITGLSNYTCSECGAIARCQNDKYCYECGARMESEE